MPAVLHLITALGTASLGGSTNEINPKNFYFSNGKSFLSRLNLYPLGYYILGKCILANPNTLSPLPPKSKLILLNFYSIPPSILTLSLLIIISSHNFQILSGFVNRQ